MARVTPGAVQPWRAVRPQSLYPRTRSSSRRSATSPSLSTPSGGSPSTTPTTPRPRSVTATTTSTGFAVAQKIRADLGDGANRVEDVEREPVPEHDDEGVAGPDRRGVAGGQLDELGVVAGAAHEPRTRRLAERDAEPQRRADPHQRLVEVLDGLDEVRLPDEDVDALGQLDGHDLPGQAQRHVGHAPTAPAGRHRSVTGASLRAARGPGVRARAPSVVCGRMSG